MMDDNFFIREIKEGVEKYFRKYYTGVCSNIQRRIQTVLDWKKSSQERFQRILERELIKKNSIVLEIGSGFGGFVTYLNMKGVKCYGVEPDFIAFSTVQRLFNKFYWDDRITQAFGEGLPYEDNSFDLVVSFSVLEHTKNPKKVLDEAIRVLKPKGHLYFEFPNYKSFWEGHYGIFWLPMLPKAVAKAYVRLLGRKASFLDSINMAITPKYIQHLLAGKKVKILDMGVNVWQHRIEMAQFTPWGNTRIMLKLSRLLKKLNCTPFVKCIGEKFELYYPIILICQKN